MGTVLRVKVPSKGDHPNRSKPQLREGDRSWEGSGERTCRSRNTNPIQGGHGRKGERASNREALMVKFSGA